MGLSGQFYRNTSRSTVVGKGEGLLGVHSLTVNMGYKGLCRLVYG